MNPCAMGYARLRQKTNFFHKLLLLSLCGMAAGCADTQILNDLTGEPAPGPMANRAGILRVDSREAVWPNLADVPSRPAAVPSLLQRSSQQTRLEMERQEGLSLLQARQEEIAAEQQPAAAAASAPLGLR